MSLLQLFQWFNQTPLSAAMRDSTWAFAVVEMIHLIGLTLLGGVVLIVDLRLLGLILRDRPAGRIARDLAPLLQWSVVAMILSGILLVGEEALKCYYNPAFRLKMILLGAALLFYFTVHRKTAAGAAIGTWQAKVAASISLALWLGVGVAGRAIGFI